MSDRQKEAQINTAVSLIAALVQDSISLYKAIDAEDAETVAQLRVRVGDDKDALRRVLEVLIA